MIYLLKKTGLNWTYLSNLQFINLYNKYNKSSRKMMKIGKFFFKKIVFCPNLSSYHFLLKYNKKKVG